MSEQTPKTDALSVVLIHLMKGIVYAAKDPALWQDLLNVQAQVRDYVSVIGLRLTIDEAEGHAWLSSHKPEEGEPVLPSLVHKRQLSFPVSLLLALLRRRMVEQDAGGDDTRVILHLDDVERMLRVYLPVGTNEAAYRKKVEGYLNRVIDLGFVRRLRDQDGMIEVQRVLKTFIDAQWLSAFDQRLAQYADHALALQGDKS